MKFFSISTKVLQSTIICGLMSLSVSAQGDNLVPDRQQNRDSIVDTTQSLDQVVVSGIRLMIPFSQQSRSITTIDAQQIQASPARSLAELL